MFGIFSLIGGLFSGVGGAIKGWFYKKTADEVIADLDKNIDKVLPVAQEGIKTVGEAAETIGVVSTSVATVAKSDNDAAIEMHKDLLDHAGGSIFAENIRPFVFLISFGLLVAQMFGYVPGAPTWPLTICLSYMGARTVDKLGQVISAASAVKNLTNLRNK